MMKFSDIIILILFVISIAVGLWYLFGNSPTLEQSILIFILSGLFVLVIRVTQISTELKFLNRRFNKLEESFIRLADDFKGSRK